MTLAEVDTFYESYQYWHMTKKPFVTAKIAMSINGVIAGPESQRIQITGEALHEFTHFSRKTTDAILTSVETIIHDDPSLNARYQNEVFAKPIYILDSQLRLPHSAKLLRTAKSVTVFYNEAIKNSHRNSSIRYIPVKKNSEGLDLLKVLQCIGQDGVHDLWIEAGGICFTSFVQQKLVQRALIYIAPRWFPEGKMAFPKEISLNEASKIHWQSFGKDVLCDIRWLFRWIWARE